MNHIFTRDEMTQFGTVVWDDVLTQWNPKRTDVYAHFVAVLKTEKDNTYRAFKRHDSDRFALIGGERTLCDAIDVLQKCFK